MSKTILTSRLFFFGFLVLVLFLNLFPVFSQVHIKERVEITPKFQNVPCEECEKVKELIHLGKWRIGYSDSTKTTTSVIRLLESTGDTCYVSDYGFVYPGTSYPFPYFRLVNESMVTVTLLQSNNSLPCWWVQWGTLYDGNSFGGADFGCDNCYQGASCLAYRNNIPSYSNINITQSTIGPLPEDFLLVLYSYYCYDLWSSVQITQIDSATFNINWASTLVMELKVLPTTYNVTSVPDTIDYNEMSTISISLTDSNAIPNDRLFNFSINSESSSYGNLIGSEGTLSTTLDNIPFWQIDSGMVKFVADGNIPYDTVSILNELPRSKLRGIFCLFE